MKTTLFWILFVSIILLGAILRFYALGDIPSSLDWDEVSQGYNSYSLLNTGKDEYGRFMPLTIRSFNDYKTPVYSYIDILPIKLFGLTPFAVRFPSALLGSISILLVYLLTHELFRKKQFAQQIGFLSMFLFAISPWSLQFSRTAFESNVGLFAVILGVLLFFKGINTKKTYYFFLGTLALGVSVHIAHSEKVFSFLILTCLLLYARKIFLAKKILAVMLISIYILFNLLLFLDNQSGARSKGVFFTSEQKTIEKSTRALIYDQDHNDPINALLHNRRLVYFNKFLENYLSHFDLNALFIYGDNARHHAPGMGVLYLFSLPLLLYGTFSIIKQKLYPGFFLLVWVLLAPIASAFAIDAPNLQRSIIFLPSILIIEAIGWVYAFYYLIRRKVWKIVIAIFIVLFSFNVIYFVHQYFVHTNYESAPYWQYGYNEAVEFVTKNHSDKRTFFENNIEQGYAFYLFYTRYNPKKYLAEGGSERKEKQCFSIDRAYFGECKDVVKRGDLLISSAATTESDKYKLIKPILYKNGERAVGIYEVL